MYASGQNHIDALLDPLEPHWAGTGSFNQSVSVTFSFVQSKDAYNRCDS